MLALIAASLLLQAAGATGDAARGAQPESNVASDFAARASAAPVDAEWMPGMPQFAFKPMWSRYNRIEGLSLAALAGTELRNKDVLALLARIGVADLVPNAELERSRERGFYKVALTAYQRLVASNDWGNPLAFGASLGAFFLGRDEGFYYRTSGIELRVVDSTRMGIEVRLFAERHRSARVKNDFAIADVFGDRDFHTNIVARDGDIGGIATVFTLRRGWDTLGFRFLGEIKLEGAAGDFDYSRGMAELIIGNPLLPVLLGSLTVSAGTSGGALPPQRLWYLGGQRSIRGQRPGVVVGDAFWMTQIEAGPPNVIARPVLFFDAGWAGSRSDFSSPGRIATGAGAGVSLFDGSMRFDIARGIYPGRAVRGALYLEARF